MKRYINAALLYAIFAMAGGINRDGDYRKCIWACFDEGKSSC